MADFSSHLALASMPVALMPTQPLDEATSRELMGANLFPDRNTSEGAPMSELCRAGLLMFNDDLARAHEHRASRR